MLYWSPLCALLSLWPHLQHPGSGSRVADETAGAFSRREGHWDRTSRTGLPFLPRGSLPDAEGVGWARPAARRPAASATLAAPAERTEKDAPGKSCRRARDELRLQVVAQTGTSCDQVLISTDFLIGGHKTPLQTWCCRDSRGLSVSVIYLPPWRWRPRHKLQTTENHGANRPTKLDSAPKTVPDL